MVIYVMRLTVLALDGVFDTALSSVLDVFNAANELGEAQEPGVGPRFDTTATL